MSPAIRDGDLLAVGRVAPASFRLGSIIVYRRGRRVLAHRVVGVETDWREASWLVLRGDALDTCDARVALSQVLGEVVAVHRQTGGCWRPDRVTALLRRALRRTLLRPGD